MARLQVADGGTASNMEGSCEYIEQAVADSRQRVVLQFGCWARCRKLLTVKPDFVANHEHLPLTWIGRWEDNIEMDLKGVGCGAWTASSWLRIGTGGGHL